ncbi:hypothetical protein GCK32_005304 [Trichostrongylus colubriformis]|uniref:Uncharacterized protein n=1 Tax=Trichostrongylus colubriformis TaxID=6319 RepID=A0AAN8ERW5_TRICO
MQFFTCSLTLALVLATVCGQPVSLSEKQIANVDRLPSESNIPFKQQQVAGKNSEMMAPITLDPLGLMQSNDANPSNGPLPLLSNLFAMPIEFARNMLSGLFPSRPVQHNVFLGREGLAAMRDQSKSLKLMQTSFDLAAMQLELLFNPI